MDAGGLACAAIGNCLRIFFARQQGSKAAGLHGSAAARQHNIDIRYKIAAINQNDCLSATKSTSVITKSTPPVQVSWVLFGR